MMITVNRRETLSKPSQVEFTRLTAVKQMLLDH